MAKRIDLDGKTARQHAECIHAAGITEKQYARARRVMTYRLEWGWGGLDTGMYYRHRHYLNRVGKYLRQIERDANELHYRSAG